MERKHSRRDITKKIFLWLLAAQGMISIFVFLSGLYGLYVDKSIFSAVSDGVMALLLLFSGPTNFYTVYHSPLFSVVMALPCLFFGIVTYKKGSILSLVAFEITWLAGGLTGLAAIT